MRKKRLAWKTSRDAFGIWMVIVFTAKGIVFTSKGARRDSIWDDARRWIRATWPARRPGAPKGNRNAAGWPAKKAARIQAELRGYAPEHLFI